MINILTLIICLSLTSYCYAGEKPICKKEKAIQAESSVPLLNNWKDIYMSYQKYRHCDDGAIAEGYSDMVVRMVASHWDRIEEFVKYADSDANFLTFVIRHIDAASDEVEIEKVIINSTEHCPKSVSTICSAIAKKARKTLSEIKN